MEELSKSDAGQMRIAKARERLDQTVADLGEQHRDDVQPRPASQGENNGVRVPAGVSRNPFDLDAPMSADPGPMPFEPVQFQQPDVEHEVMGRSSNMIVPWS